MAKNTIGLKLVNGRGGNLDLPIRQILQALEPMHNIYTASGSTEPSLPHKGNEDLIENAEFELASRGSSLVLTPNATDLFECAMRRFLDRIRDVAWARKELLQRAHFYDVRLDGAFRDLASIVRYAAGPPLPLARFGTLMQKGTLTPIDTAYAIVSRMNRSTITPRAFIALTEDGVHAAGLLWLDRLPPGLPCTTQVLRFLSRLRLTP